MFKFVGPLAASKSWMNRALILKSWNNDVTINGESKADDVLKLQKALQDLSNGKTEYDAGHGGTTFRFLAVRLSRNPGQFFIQASPALLKRPQQELIHFFDQVGVQAHLTDRGLQINSQGWKQPSGPVHVSTEDSSQFISAVLLSSAELDFAFDLKLSEKMTSESYMRMTLDLLSQTCQHLQLKSLQIQIPRNLQVKKTILNAELDLSSAFSLIAAAVIQGDVTITNWKSQSLQPDLAFLKIFDQMKISYAIDGTNFHIHQQKDFQGTNYDLGLCPDLFPVLCVLASFAKTSSKFFGAPHLKFKESDRIQKTAELLSLCHIKTEMLNDGMIVHPGPKLWTQKSFDPAEDHRMAMAAALYQLRGFPITILHPETVNKSYPDFFKHVGLS